MIKICVSGSRGKMGSRIIALAKDDPQVTVSGTFDIDGQADENIRPCDCLIEFTTPEAVIGHLAMCLKHKKAAVIGTTGLSDSEKNKIKEASQKIPIVFSPNMSIGVNLIFELAGRAAKALDSSYNVRIKEAHHAHKKDAPSGTAKELVRIIKEAPRSPDIPIESIRQGDIVGDHIVTFESPLDKVQIIHSAKTRDIFAKGALEAAKFIVGKKKGFFTMKDVLSI